MDFEDLKDPEFQERLKTAKTADELVALVREQGMDLSDKQLDALSGGTEWYEPCEAHKGCTELPHQPV